MGAVLKPRETLPTFLPIPHAFSAGLPLVSWECRNGKENGNYNNGLGFRDYGGNEEMEKNIDLPQWFL